MNNKKQTTQFQQCLLEALTDYLDDLNGQTPNNLYSLILDQVERPLLEFIMQRADGNQSQAADMLGINRNTLRKKLTNYDLIWLP